MFEKFSIKIGIYAFILFACLVIFPLVFLNKQKSVQSNTTIPSEAAITANTTDKVSEISATGKATALIAPAKANESVKSFSIAKKDIGQMLIIGFRGTEITENSAIAKQIKGLNLGGVILFDYDLPSKTYGRNIKSESQTKQLISGLKNINSSLFISVDVEGGKVNRLKSFLPLMSAQEIGENPQLAKNEFEKTVAKLQALGFNMDFAPILDVNINPASPVIGKMGRSYSSDPKAVADIAEIFIKALKAKDIIAVVKHFPGHGSSQADSHLGLVDITKTYQRETELLPYKILQNKGLLTSVMTAHIINKTIDPKYPATLSALYLKNILRDEIGFDGVIVSDDMQMKAITDYYGLKQGLVLAINAGCNILVLSNNSQSPHDSQLAQKAVDYIWQAIQDGSISEAKIEQSLNKISDLKKQFAVSD